jgi:hypothetical protein
MIGSTRRSPASRGAAMKRIAVLAVVFAVVAVLPAAEPDGRIYELRTYTANPGKLDALNARFRDHTCKLFEKHGITNIGYWMPVENTDNKLIYIIAHADRPAAAKSWKEFIADPDWQKAMKASEVGGKLVSKIDSKLMSATEYSPPIKPPTSGEHLYELRTYTAEPGRLDALNARFRDHTAKYFEKHGMTNVGYWNLLKGDKGADTTLIYMLAHKDGNTAKKSWAAFREDPVWIAARKASEAKAGGALTVKDGVKSVLMKATDYSPMK